MRRTTNERRDVSPPDAVDFLVIGAGAAGGVMAKELSTAGFRVVVLEQRSLSARDGLQAG
jgi:choline dehydrogenase-like flavoprotein